jgi:ABC-type transport system involved in multi-copper enzyme maturation permease subunit
MDKTFSVRGLIQFLLIVIIVSLIIIFIVSVVEKLTEEEEKYETIPLKLYFVSLADTTDTTNVALADTSKWIIDDYTDRFFVLLLATFTAYILLDKAKRERRSDEKNF